MLFWQRRCLFQMLSFKRNKLACVYVSIKPIVAIPIACSTQFF